MSNFIPDVIREEYKMEKVYSKRAIFELDSRDYIKEVVGNDSLVFAAMAWRESELLQAQIDYDTSCEEQMRWC